MPSLTSAQKAQVVSQFVAATGANDKTALRVSLALSLCLSFPVLSSPLALSIDRIRPDLSPSPLAHPWTGPSHVSCPCTIPSPYSHRRRTVSRVYEQPACSVCASSRV